MPKSDNIPYNRQSDWPTKQAKEGPRVDEQQLAQPRKDSGGNAGTCKNGDAISERKANTLASIPFKSELYETENSVNVEIQKQTCSCPPTEMRQKQ